MDIIISSSNNINDETNSVDMIIVRKNTHESCSHILILHIHPTWIHHNNNNNYIYIFNPIPSIYRTSQFFYCTYILNKKHVTCSINIVFD